MRRFMYRFPLLGLSMCVVAAVGLAGCPPAGNPRAPEANFSASPTQGISPLTVQFTDTSLPGTSPIGIWYWDFGDGTYGNTPNPSHVYSAPGVYTVSLTVETAEGKDTLARVDLITVNVRSAFVLIGPEGGAVSAGGAVVTVPANARTSDTAVGITWMEEPFTVASSETILVVSDAFRITHDGQDTGFARIETAGVLAPTTIDLPVLAGAAPPADRNGDKIHLLAKLDNGQVIPVFGQLQGNRLIVSVTGLPNHAIYGAVYRPAAQSRTVTPAVEKILTGTDWPAQWRIRLSALVAQQLTGLRVGEIDNTAPYLRTDFSNVDVNATLAALDTAIGSVAGAYAEAGLRTPLLLNQDGAFDLAFYNFIGDYPTDYERYADLLLSTRLFGTLVIDPRQLIAVSLHNAANAAGNPDGAQELTADCAFAQLLYLASFEGYDYPEITAVSPVDVDDAGVPRRVSFAQALIDGIAAYAGQVAAGFEVARTFDPGEVSRLSQPLLAPFSALTPGYAASAQDFLLLLSRVLPENPFGFLFGPDTGIAGIIEQVRLAIDALPIAPDFEQASEELRFAASGALETYFGQTLAQLYWRFAQMRGVEADEMSALRPSDVARAPLTLQTDQFGESAIVETAFSQGENTVFAGPDEAPALRDIPPLSSRAVAIGIEPETPMVSLTFNREEWETDALGNSVAVKVYPEGKGGVELAPGESNLVVTLIEPICPLPDDPALLIQILFPLFDLDDDGGLSLTEVQALEPSISELVFGFADLNADGVLSLDEVLALVPVPLGNPLALIDINGNGYLERAELPGLSDEEFALLDVNGNGAFDCGDLPLPEGKQAQEEPEENPRLVVLISNLNLSAANSVYVNAARPPVAP